MKCMKRFRINVTMNVNVAESLNGPPDLGPVCYVPIGFFERVVFSQNLEDYIQ